MLWVLQRWTEIVVTIIVTGMHTASKFKKAASKLSNYWINVNFMNLFAKKKKKVQTQQCMGHLENQKKTWWPEYEPHILITHT